MTIVWDLMQTAFYTIHVVRSPFKSELYFYILLEYPDNVLIAIRKYSLTHFLVYYNRLMHLLSYEKKTCGKEANRFIKQWPEEKISIENERWGPVIKFGKNKFKPGLNKDGAKFTPEALALLELDDVIKIILQQNPKAFDSKGKKATIKKKAAAKKPAAKKN